MDSLENQYKILSEKQREKYEVKKHALIERITRQKQRNLKCQNKNKMITFRIADLLK